jgi:hypothetical protein
MSATQLEKRGHERITCAGSAVKSTIDYISPARLVPRRSDVASASESR